MNNRLSIPELAGLIAEYAGVEKKKAERFLKEFVAIIRETVFEDKIVKVKGIGTFKIIEVQPRESVDVNTGNRIVIPGHYKFSFTPDKDLRENVNRPFSFFETVEINDHVATADMEHKEEEIEQEEPQVAEIPENITKIEEPEPSEPPIEEPEPEEEVIEEPESIPIPEEENNVLVQTEEIKEPLIQEEQQPDYIEEELKEESEPIIESKNSLEEIPEEEKRPGYFIPTVEIAPIQETTSSTSKLKVWWIASAIVILVGTGGFFFFNRYPLYAWSKPETDIDVVVDSIVDNLISEMLIEADSIEADKELALDTGEGKPSGSDETESGVITPENEVLATVKINAGNRLTLIALEYYGEKVFWVYLYEYNKDIIKDPNNVPIGTEIKIPAPELYNINSKSRASIEKAALLQSQILSNL